MNKEFVFERLKQLIIVYTYPTLPERNSDIMGNPCFMPAHDAAAFFIDIEKEFSIDLNELLPFLKTFSMDDIAERVSNYYDKK